MVLSICNLYFGPCYVHTRHVTRVREHAKHVKSVETTTGMAKLLKHGPQRVLKLDRWPGPGAEAWCVLVVHLIRK